MWKLIARILFSKLLGDTRTTTNLICESCWLKVLSITVLRTYNGGGGGEGDGCMTSRAQRAKGVWGLAPIFDDLSCSRIKRGHSYTESFIGVAAVTFYSLDCISFIRDGGHGGNVFWAKRKRRAFWIERCCSTGPTAVEAFLLRSILSPEAGEKITQRLHYILFPQLHLAPGNNHLRLIWFFLFSISFLFTIIAILASGEECTHASQSL